MRDFTLRPAAPTDQSAIRDLIQRVQINPMNLHWEHFVLAVDERGKMIGCGQIKTHRDGSRELASIAVEPCCRGQGVARAVIEHLIAGANPPLYLTCRSRLEPLYEKFGFRRVESARDMPPYFRLIARLFKILRWLFRMEDALAVMVWRGEL